MVNESKEKKRKSLKETGSLLQARGIKKGKSYLVLVEVAYPHAKMTATIVRKPIHPIKLGLEPTNL